MTFLQWSCSRQHSSARSNIPSCSYPRALLPAPHHKVPGSIHERFLRDFIFMFRSCSGCSLLWKFDSFIGWNTHGPSGYNNALKLYGDFTWLSKDSPSHRDRYVPVTKGSSSITHSTGRSFSDDHKLKYKSNEWLPSIAPRKNVRRVCPASSVLVLRQKFELSLSDLVKIFRARTFEKPNKEKAKAK